MKIRNDLKRSQLECLSSFTKTNVLASSMKAKMEAEIPAKLSQRAKIMCYTKNQKT